MVVALKLNTIQPDINNLQQYIGQRKEQLSEKVCCSLVFLQNTVLKCVSVVDF